MARTIKQIQIDLENGVEDLVQRVAFAALSTVAQATPVGDPTLWDNPSSAPEGYVGGRARGNWQIGIGTDPVGETGIIDPSPTAVRSISNGRSVLGLYRLGPSVVIANNVPYIGRLNDGHSTQARPAGFVERAVQSAVLAIEQSGPII